jgi:hypothetical protein
MDDGSEQPWANLFNPERLIQALRPEVIEP